MQQVKRESVLVQVLVEVASPALLRELGANATVETLAPRKVIAGLLQAVPKAAAEPAQVESAEDVSVAVASIWSKLGPRLVGCSMTVVAPMWTAALVPAKKRSVADSVSISKQRHTAHL